MYKRLDSCRVHVSRTLADAMWALDRGAVEIALVLDSDDRLVGTLTDGDIRRALLRGASLESPLEPYLQRNFTAVDPSTSRAEVIELMQARTISQIPIMDGDRRLLGLHLLHELIGCVERPNWAVIMAGGKGTRLAPLTEHIPKPMIRVAGRPILERLVLHLVGYGIQRIFLSVNYLAHVVEEHFGNGERYGCRIDYLRETRPLGSGGALSLLPEPPSDPVLVLNGDLVTQADIASMLQFHERGGYRATMAVKEYYHAIPYGCVELEGDRITRLEEKPLVGRLVNAGIYVVDPELVARVPADREFLMTSLFEQALERGEPVGAFQILADWIDVGQRDQLRTACEGSA